MRFAPVCSDKVESWDSALSRLARTLRFASESRYATSVCGRVRSRFLCKSLVVYARSAGVAALSTPEKILGDLVLGIEKLHETAGDFGLILIHHAGSAQNAMATTCQSNHLRENKEKTKTLQGGQ